MRNQILIIGLSLVFSGCGGGSAPNATTQPTPTPTPTSTPGSYHGIPYAELGNPPGFSNYPQAYLPTFSNSNSAEQDKIAYGRNNESQVAGLTANVSVINYICSATPVYYDAKNNLSYLIGAAHCFVLYKDQAKSLTPANLVPPANIAINYGRGGSAGWQQTYSIQAIFIRQDYCYGSNFSEFSGCPNFDPSSPVGGQGNDIALIQIKGKYADPNLYPQIAPLSEYPAAGSMAPVLSLGYGLNTQTPIEDDSSLSRNIMFYVANYFYAFSDFPADSGYSYLYNSYYNSGAFNQSGYADLICGGDSGGGDLFWTGSKWILLSEHTYGPASGCGVFYDSYPDAATNVASYYGWLEQIIQDNTESGPVADCASGAIANCVTNG